MARLLKQKAQTEKATSRAVATFIADAMNERGIDINTLAGELGITYEHTRRIVRGEAVPSRLLVTQLSRILEVSVDELQRLATYDRLNAKFDGIPAELADKKPGMAPLEVLWDHLTSAQQQDLINLASSWSKANRHS